ncbi:MAG: NfeD family protein [Calditrichota bacterium]|jgi:membrane protein implicated in regulation of membrane protease activity
MYHFVLLMPLLAIVLFWILPLSVALPVYLVILIASILIYISLLRAMHRPVTTGQQSLLGETCEITDIKNHKGHVMIHGEIWEADISGRVHKGDEAIVTGVKGLRLKVQKAEEKNETDIKGLHSTA